MRTENDRIKEVRKALDLTQEKFGEKIGMKKSSLSTVENGVNAVSNQLRTAVCREFHVREEWLRTGEGEMFEERTPDQAIVDFAADLVNVEDDAFKKRLISALARMDDQTWESFEKWYQSQKHYRTAEDRENDKAQEEATLTFPQAAAILGLPRQQFYLILKDKRYSHFFEFVEVAGRRRVTKASFGRFLNGQDRYCIVEKKDPETIEKPAVLSESPSAETDEFKTKKEWLLAKDAPITFMTIEEAALQSGISPQAISRYAMRGHFGEGRKIGGKVRIPEKHFQKWMTERQEGEMAHGFN